MAAAAQTGWGLPRDVSVHGHRIDGLIHVTVALTALLFVVMVAWMLYACLRHGPGHVAVPTRGESVRAKAIPLGIAAFVLFVVDGNLFLHSTRDMGSIFLNFAAAESRADTLRVEVNAHQWAWDFRYPGKDGEFNTADDVVELNELRIPVDTPIVLQFAAVDVIHSFYLPNFRVKMDCVPGVIHGAWFQAREVGEYEIGCAQHCGASHYKMKGKLTVMSREDFDRWTNVASALAARAYDPTDPQAHWGWPWKKLP